jgi:hypothetical protein
MLAVVVRRETLLERLHGGMSAAQIRRLLDRERLRPAN